MVLYYLLPKRFRWCILLLMSISFYLTYGIYCLYYIGFTIVSTYAITRAMAVTTQKKTRKRLLLLGLFANFGILVFLKYCNFTIGNLNQLFTVFHIKMHISKLGLLMPLGISFYTFQTMSYLIDIYYQKYEPEKNIFKFALFVSFLPQLLQGPIGRFDKLAPQLFEGNDFEIKNVEYGLQRIAWGLAKKLILADRANVIASAVLHSVSSYSGSQIVAALLLFSIYEYCDFAGGIDVVIGCAELFGIHFDENFRQPYFSKSIGEFWRRWHITLGTWMKDYVFYPFSISKSMARFGKYAKKKFGRKTGRVLPVCLANLLIFFIVGVWHGAAWKYILYGFYNGLIIAVSNLLKPHYEVWAKKCHIRTAAKGWGYVQMLRTFILVNIGWLFDGCKTATDAFIAMKRIVLDFHYHELWDGRFLKLGLAMRDWKILLIATVILLITSIMKERGVHLRDYIAAKPLVIRWAVYLLLVFATAPFGYVGTTTEFMYAQF